jgi:Icc protein
MTLISPLHVVQITDIHLFAQAEQRLLGLPTLESFRAVLRQVANLSPRPQLLLLTGDLSQDGKPESYQLLQNAFAQLGIPTYWLPGNHDCFSVMEEVLGGGSVSNQKSVQAGGWRFLLLNSQVPGRVHGRLSHETLAWLDRQLSRREECPVAIGLHHPPFAVGSTWLDGSALQNSESLFAILDQHPRVKLVMFGHIHQDYSYQRRGVQYLGTPSTSIQFEPHSHDFALGQEVPGFRIFQLYPDGTYHTRVERSTFAHQLDLAATGY